MGDFRVKLDPIKRLAAMGHAGDGTAVGTGDEFEILGQFHHLVAVAHPHIQQRIALVIEVVANVVQQTRVHMQPDLGVAKFADIGAGDLAAKLLRHGLHAIADAQHRHPEFEHAGGGAGRGMGGN